MFDLPTLSFRLSGQSPLLCHNGQTADPRNSYAKAMKAISGKRKKTDADLEELSRIEWLAGLYRTADDLVITSHVLESAFVAGAKKSKRGQQAKSGLFVPDHASLQFEGKPSVINDDTLQQMYESDAFTFTCGVRVNMSKVMRTRPMFKDWSLMVTVQYDPDLLNPQEVKDFIADAGRQVGIGDWRPKYGRFTATPVEQPVVIPDAVPLTLGTLFG
jgi:hypothetical protein